MSWCACVFYFLIWSFNTWHLVLFSVYGIPLLQRSRAVLDELESLKPEFKRRVENLNDSHVKAPLPKENGFNQALQSSANSSLDWPAVNRSYNLGMDFKQVRTWLTCFSINFWMLKILNLFGLCHGASSRYNMKCLKIFNLEFSFCFLIAFCLSVCLCEEIM